MEEIKLGGEPINRCDIFVFDDIVQVRIWMTVDECFDAFQRGGASYERKVLMSLRNKLFSSSSLNIEMFHDQTSFKEFCSRYSDIKDGWFNSTFIVLTGSNKHEIISEIKNQFNAKFNNQTTTNMNEEIEKIINYSDYYSAGTMEYGVDGPEVDDDKLYISIYHYLEYLGKNPRNFDTFGLGNYLTGRSSKYKSCKYESQPFSINKFDLDILKREEGQFNKFEK